MGVPAVVVGADANEPAARAVREVNRQALCHAYRALLMPIKLMLYRVLGNRAEEESRASDDP